jgi:hypothetical protein
MSGLNDFTDIMASPPGLCSMIAEYAYKSAWTPSRGAAQFTGLTLASGITGRGYMTYTGAGLNTFNAYIADTGVGKDTIKNTTDSLFAAIASIEGSSGIRGPGFIASAPGLLRALEANPLMLCNISEIGKRLQEWNNPRNPVGVGIQVLFRELYGRSGKGKTMGASAYADATKNIGLIHQPSLTLAAEGVPHEIWQALNEDMVSGGTVPRFSFFIDQSPRAYSNRECGKVTVSADLANLFGDVVGYALANAHIGEPIVVPPSHTAEQYLDSFDDECTELINDKASDEVIKHLWNRAHLKALKFASISAVSFNYLKPEVCREDAIWAIELVKHQTRQIINKFERNEVGGLDGDESKQLDELIKAIGRYAVSPYAALKGYGGFTEEMHRGGFITESYLSRVLTKRAVFKADKRGATVALKRALDNLLNGDEIREMARAQTVASFSTSCRGFMICNADRFLKAISTP